ncbi:hypothetical protein BS47DRAFT_1321727 [Hydnum rufescens UP504]|uniref:Sugar phosphate transporter domain-containing protein n=1 Tax=Hydnum rufescens UP504 TaxID=1448309 RepID=A0A9P6AIR2_9AGAM|nr:hypothetical protein BS47DRAFT_1321727 [Hydnum rufescens UP504]
MFRSTDENELGSQGGLPLPESDNSEILHDPQLLNWVTTVAERKRRWWREAFINGLFIASWFSLATILSLYNKWMFSPDKFGFPFPIFVTSVHMVVQFVLAGLLRTLFPKLFRPPRGPSIHDYSKNAIPCAITTGADIGISNLSLKLVTLSFYTMCKSSSLIFVLMFAFLFRLERFSWRLVAVILTITGGVVLMVASETQLVVAGMLLVILASALGGLRWALTQILLNKKEMGMDNPVATIFWLAPSMAITLAVMSMIIEGFHDVFRTRFFDGMMAIMRTLVFILFPGVFAFAMVMTEYYIIQRVGMVPMSIAGIFKEVTTITLSTWVFGDDLTPLNMIGVGITIFGISLFTYDKYTKSVLMPLPKDDELEVLHHLEESEVDMFPIED